MGVYVRPFRASDLKAFVPIEPMSEAEFGDAELVQSIEEAGFAVTGIRDGKIVGCGGVLALEDREYQGELWLRLSQECQDHPFDTLRWLINGMKIIENTFPFDQLYAIVRCGFAKSIRLIEHLGFTKVKEQKVDGQGWLVYKKAV